MTSVPMRASMLPGGPQDATGGSAAPRDADGRCVRFSCSFRLEARPANARIVWLGCTAIITMLIGLPACPARAEPVAVDFRVHVPAGTPTTDTVFLTGDDPRLGSWRPDGVPLTRRGDGTLHVRVELMSGRTIHYKVTRGTWQTVEKGEQGQEVPNRRLEVSADQRVDVRVASWAHVGTIGTKTVGRVVRGDQTPAGDVGPRPEDSAGPPGSVPDWVVDAVFYQIFPERFRNGDSANDPTRESLEFPDVVPGTWRISPWTGDWYARGDWERALGNSFYEDGVFHRRYGGDLQGVLDKLNYLSELGVNAIYFNPLFYARSLHKYDGNTYHHIDPTFGPDPAGDLRLMTGETSDPATWQWTAADELFLRLVRAAHRRGIRVILDGVFNHTGRDFFAFVDLRKHQRQSPYREWYVVDRFDDPSTAENEVTYQGWWGIDTLPEFADNANGTDLHPGPRKYIFDATARWMDPNGDGDPTDGVDGWRLDVANEVPAPFWVAWNRHVRRINPDAYTVCEIWNDASGYLKTTHFSASMNYHGFAFPVKGFLIDGAITADQFARQLNTRRGRFPAPVRLAQLNLIDSHDTDRLASMIVNRRASDYENPTRFDYDVTGRVSPRQNPHYKVRRPDDRERQLQRLVALFQMTYVGAPMIYYGTEAGMWGGDDPDDRMPMVWPDLSYARQAADPLGRPRQGDRVAFDAGLFDFYRRAIKLRRDHPSLRHGSFRLLAVDDRPRTMAYVRSCDGDRLVVILNRGDHQVRCRVALGTDQDSHGWEVGFASSGSVETVPVKQVDGAIQLDVPQSTGVVLQPR
ncbi:MAG: alpha-amylase family glycosyl hydrolase [Pirellulales bacterium]